MLRIRDHQIKTSETRFKANKGQFHPTSETSTSPPHHSQGQKAVLQEGTGVLGDKLNRHQIHSFVLREACISYWDNSVTVISWLIKINCSLFCSPYQAKRKILPNWHKSLSNASKMIRQSVWCSRKKLHLFSLKNRRRKRTVDQTADR